MYNYVKKNMKKINKGFTLIELLVVLAIIGILTSVVLGSLNTARAKSGNTAVKANLSGLRSQAEIVFDDNNHDYTNVCSDPNVISAINAALIASGDTGTVATRCNSNTAEWAANVMLKIPEGANTYWCIDVTGEPKGEPAELGGATLCA